VVEQAAPSRPRTGIHPGPCAIWIPWLLTAAGVLACAATLPAAARAAPQQHCRALKGRRLLSSRALEVVERSDEGKGLVYACVPPAGRVRLAGYAYDATIAGNYSIRIAAVAGSWLALDAMSTIDPHTSEEVGKVFDASSGRAYRYFQAASPEGPGFEDIPSSGDSVGRVLLNRFGQLALALLGEGTSRIVGIEPSGARRSLDTGPQAQLPAASLRLEGHTVRWIDAGVARRAKL
jgi:hypothetical protein